MVTELSAIPCSEDIQLSASTPQISPPGTFLNILYRKSIFRAWLEKDLGTEREVLICYRRTIARWKEDREGFSKKYVWSELKVKCSSEARPNCEKSLKMREKKSLKSAYIFEKWHLDMGNVANIEVSIAFYHFIAKKSECRTIKGFKMEIKGPKNHQKKPTCPKKRHIWAWKWRHWSVGPIFLESTENFEPPPDV